MFNYGVLFNWSQTLNIGTITEYMKSRRIRSISIKNYLKWKGYDNPSIPVGTVRLDLYDGRLKMFNMNKTMLSDKEVDKDCSEVYEMINEISENEKLIPCNKRRNIIVKINR